MIIVSKVIKMMYDASNRFQIHSFSMVFFFAFSHTTADGQNPAKSHERVHS